MPSIKQNLMIFVPLLLATSATQAQEQYYNFGFIGGSVSYSQSVFSEQDDTETAVEPNLFYYGDYGFIDGSLINIAILPYLGVSGHWRFEQVSDDVNDIPSGIENREGNGELGVTLGTVGARLTYLQDVTNQHDGYEIQLHLGRTLDLPFNKFTLTPYIEVDYRDKKLSSHLYSVSPLESSQSGLTEFEADKSWLYQAGLIGIYTLSDNWLALAKMEFEHHDSDSPLIQRDLGWDLSIGISYQFIN